MKNMLFRSLIVVFAMLAFITCAWTEKNAHAQDDDLALVTVTESPNKGIYVLSVKGIGEGDVKIRVSTPERKEIFMKIIPQSLGNFKETIDLSKEPKGVYNVQVIQATRTFTRKVFRE